MELRRRRSPAAAALDKCSGVTEATETAVAAVSSPSVPPCAAEEANAQGGSGTCSLAVVATLAAAALRLYKLHEPQTPVYDETHVGRFLSWYHDRAFFFDVHGPLSKLLIYWTAAALGFDGRNSCPYESVTPYAARCDLAPQRLLPALCGVAIVPLTLSTCSQMGLHPTAGALAGWLILTDSLWISLSRLHLNDMVLMLFIALTHQIALGACRLPPAQLPLPAASTTAARLAATGVALGCALQCKYAMALTTMAWLGLQNLWVSKPIG